MEALFNKTVGTAKSVSAAAFSHATSAKDFVVEKAQMAKLKVSSHIRGVSDDPFEDIGLERGRFIVEIIEAKDVPRCDVFSASDPFVEVYFCVKDVKGIDKVFRVSDTFVTPIRVDTNNPVWHYFANLNVIPRAGSFLKLNIYDSDFDDNAVLKARTLLGHIQVPIEELSSTAVLVRRLAFHNHGCPTQNPDFSIAIRRAFLDAPPPSLKTFFIIRHGESKWNRAEDKRDIPALLAFDHPLTDTGIHQVSFHGIVYSSLFL